MCLMLCLSYSYFCSDWLYLFYSYSCFCSYSYSYSCTNRSASHCVLLWRSVATQPPSSWKTSRISLGFCCDGAAATSGHPSDFPWRCGLVTGADRGRPPRIRLWGFEKHAGNCNVFLWDTSVDQIILRDKDKKHSRCWSVVLACMYYPSMLVEVRNSPHMAFFQRVTGLSSQWSCRPAYHLPWNFIKASLHCSSLQNQKDECLSTKRLKKKWELGINLMTYVSNWA